MKNSYNQKIISDISSTILIQLTYILFSVICLSTYTCGTETSPEQLDPTNLLPYPSMASQDTSPPVQMHPAATAITSWEQLQSGPASDGVVSAAPTADVNQKSPRFLNSTVVSGSTFINNLWEDRITAPENENDKKTKNELQRMIEQIRSFKFEPQKQTSEHPITAQSAPAAGTENASPDANTQGKAPAATVHQHDESIEKEIKALLPNGTLTEKTLDVLKNLTQHPEQAEHPFELAEVLFTSGRLKEAGIFYHEALKRSSPDKESAVQAPPCNAQNRAWMLFQAGNCLRDYDDLPSAAKLYEQLITEYPDSPWTDFAKTECQLINWYQKDNPHKLIAESKP